MTSIKIKFTSYHYCSIAVIFLIVFMPISLAQHYHPEQNNEKQIDRLTPYRSWDLPQEISKHNTENKHSLSEYPDIEKQFYFKYNKNQGSSPMDSAWPIICHDTWHTSQSPYSTADNPGTEKWRFRVEHELGGEIESSAVIDNSGTIYFGSMGCDHQLYALNPDGTLKWKYNKTYIIWSSPAIDEQGIIYFSSIYNYPTDFIFALYSTNGTLKWKYPISGTISSPAIADDGTIVFGDEENFNIIALYPNGTLRWSYHADHWTSSSPAISDDNIVYCGSWDNNLYALYLSNGSLKWKYKTGGRIKGHPSIGSDGTVYMPSFDGYLYALNPDGTLKWKNSYPGDVAAASAAIASDGTLYVGGSKLYAFSPEGAHLWSCDVGGSIYGTMPAISVEGTIYVSAGKSLVAVNPNGTVQWRKQICNLNTRSSPVIGKNGVIYVGSTSKDENHNWYGVMHAFGPGKNLTVDAGGPYHGITEVSIKMQSTVLGGVLPYSYLWDFGDGNTSTSANPTHIYGRSGDYTVTLTVVDGAENSSTDTTEVSVGTGWPEVRILRPTCHLYVWDHELRSTKVPIIFGPITIEVEAYQKEAAIEKVSIYIDYEYAFTDYEAPYTFRWRRGPLFGSYHKVTAEATTVDGRGSYSAIYVWKFL